MDTIGWLSLMEPVEPKNGASPKAKMPPSLATSQYPFPLGLDAIPVMGLLSFNEPVDP